MYITLVVIVVILLQGELDHYIPYQWRDWFFICYDDGLLVWNDYCVIRLPYGSNGYFYYLMDDKQHLMYSDGGTYDDSDPSLVAKVQSCCNRVKEGRAPCAIHSPLTLWVTGWRLVSTVTVMSLISYYDTDVSQCVVDDVTN